jgi:selT/selW/selH-like putative selenoprotein
MPAKKRAGATAEKTAKKAKTTKPAAKAAKAYVPDRVLGSAESELTGTLHFEHCTSWGTYKTRAKALVDAVKAMFPKLIIKVNASKPRKGAFDLILNDKVVWSGHPLGPPRNLKFDILIGAALHDAIMAK